MKELIRKVLGSFDTFTKNAFSARKLTALSIMLCVIVAHIAWLKHAFVKEDFTLLAEVLMIDYGMISLCLGMTTYEAIKNKKNETKNSSDTPTDSTLI
jgi:hypothetical protein